MPNIITRPFFAKGTTCSSCVRIIREQALKVRGVKDINFDLVTEKGRVSFDRNRTTIERILKKIEEKGYECSTSRADNFYNYKKIFGWVFGLLGIIVAGYFIFHFVDSINIPQISQNMGYGLLLLVGLLTGFHCVSMCGGFVVSYTAKDAKDGKLSHKSHIMYGLGKIISYTVIGALFGLIGSIIALTPLMRGVAGVLAGLFLIVFGLKMLHIFPFLRNFQLRLPSSLSKLLGKEYKKNSNPLIIGLLNGLMIACGPLQAIYIMAAGTGSLVEGAKLLFVFAIGTLPVMLGFGYLASFISNKATHKILKASGIVIIILGLLMFNNGLVLAGTGYDFKSIISYISDSDSKELGSSNLPIIKKGIQQIKMEVNRYGWTPNKFVLKKGVPVEWIIEGKEINGCNNAIQVPNLGLQFNIKKGTQVIKFTPKKEGIIRWSCWMGMIPGTFIVKGDLDLNDKRAIENELNRIPAQQRSSCGASGGRCGCGGR